MTPRLRNLLTLVAVVVGVALVAALGSRMQATPADAPTFIPAAQTLAPDPTSAPTEPPLGADPVVGTRGIADGNADRFPCAATREKLRAAYEAVDKGDEDGFAEALADGGATLTRGVSVLVIDTAMGSGYNQGVDVQVRILDGPDAHLACWVWQNPLHLRAHR